MHEAVIATTLTETDHNYRIFGQNQEMFFDEDGGSDFLRLTASGIADWGSSELQGANPLGQAVTKGSITLRLVPGGNDNWPLVEQADPVQALDFMFYPGREIRQIRPNQGGGRFPIRMPPQEDVFARQRRRYANRIKELRKLAEDEGIDPVIPESKEDFFKFLSIRDFPVRRASLALLDDGTLGATWRNEHWRLGLRFCGDGQAEYVLLDRTNPPEGATGKSDLKNFSVNCDRLNLRALLTE